MLKSGIDCLDERLGGLAPGRVHLLTGCPGSGKTAAALEFLNHGLEDGASCALLTVDDPDDLMAQCEFLGIDLDEALESGQLVLLRYQLDFARRSSRLPSPEQIFQEFERLLGGTRPARVAIDSIAPLLEAGPASGGTVLALVECLEQLGSTSLLTLHGPPDLALDRRLEPLVRRAAALLDLDVGHDGLIEFRIRKVRYPVPSTEPVKCRIVAGRGFVSAARSDRRRADERDAPDPRRVLVLDLAGTLPDDLLAALHSRFDVSHHSDIPAAFSALAEGTAGAVVIGTRRDSLQDALTLVRELRRAGNRSSIILLTSSALRSSDGARALRAGADDFLAATLPIDELVLRVEAAARRGHSATGWGAVEPVLVPATADGDGRAPLASRDFRTAVTTHLRNEPLPFFTLVTIRPHDASDLQLLSEVVAENMRADGGDLTGLMDDHVAVYLHSARRKDVGPFVARVNSAWSEQGRGSLRVETVAWPADEARIGQMLATRES